ncbi:Cysteine desulfurase [Pseudopedobacter saltans DSM 12145]|uniref:cysteine desulfurase n=1 Tax=Pseudopedobacter saltans (strain ATCC 51119 / DSM 12145 / JCM 21818 / CCUG 39354 / LMG 10337 / NBRC 100064 / NCIMB 13643) TaxID=762903 RepID=F0SAK6_PSESL|nr:cysteine desulfurase family protein [Pseudopedobacter saltans]ADY52626.1 Cysteine desulfurase [Pseudopedobacter saltans DSM 12145]
MKRKVYLDNAATTPLDDEVKQVMIAVMEDNFGNPSSIHAHGREVRTIIEKARKNIANLLNTAPANIFFTSSGTEADNTAIRRSVVDLGVKHIITSPLEHHAVLHTVEMLERSGVTVSYVNVDDKGNIDYEQLENLLQTDEKSLVSLMQANNEIGTLTDIERIGELCQQYNALFHCDTVQTVGHYKHDLSTLKVDFIACSAHKIHGPKGVGFIYINPRIKINPMIYGGAQERNMRGGTENIYGIAGLSKALSLAYEHMGEHHLYIQELKDYMKTQLEKEIPGVGFNGEISPEKSLYTVLSVSFPEMEMADMLLFKLDIGGVSASGGSACSSGTNIGSHVLTAIKASPDRPAVRFSFSKYNTKEEIDYVIQKVKEVYRDTE